MVKLDTAIQNGFDVNATDECGRNRALMAAFLSQNIQMIQALNVAGAQDFGGIVQHLAARAGRHDIEQLQRNFNATSATTARVLESIMNGDVEEVAQAIAAGFYVNASNPAGDNIALLAAVKAQSVPVLNLLIQHGAVDSTNAALEAAFEQFRRGGERAREIMNLLLAHFAGDPRVWRRR